MDYSRLGGCRERVHRVRTAAERREREKRVLYSCRSHSIYTVYISISSAWRESKKTHKSSSSLTSAVFFFFFLVCSFTISLFLYSLEFLSFSSATPNNLTGLHGSQRERETSLGLRFDRNKDIIVGDLDMYSICQRSIDSFKRSLRYFDTLHLFGFISTRFNAKCLIALL